ncbi:MAG: RNA-binding transcriptional accessory protein [Bacteroidales bacterium]|nr:RNA-binding transcriptional accessory protein [Bacteroidales bacterium]
MIPAHHISQIAAELNIAARQVSRTAELLKEGATVPFISRYRKELTGSLDEVQISQIRDRMAQLEELDKRREAILSSIREQEKLTPELEKAIEAARTMAELEDLYLPYRPKRKTRATMAIAKGLEPLAKLLFSQGNFDPEEKALAFVDDEKGVESIDEALAGARDIIAEWVNEDAPARARIRRLFEREAEIGSRVAKGKETEAQKYEAYFDWTEKIQKAPSHRILAMFRGENEGFLKISIAPDRDTALEMLNRQFVKGRTPASEQVALAVEDSYKRLLGPSIETEIRKLLKEQADLEAIRVFADNLRQLLLAPPLGQKRILAIDPGFRTGCKLVCLDREGKLLHNETIYPHPPQSQFRQSAAKIQSLVNAYQIEAIAVGNGTAGRETEQLVRSIRFDKPVIAVMVNESGASVYSASAVAREEFPDYDVTVRGAVSIGRRLTDPLAELVKIDPKSIGVGQYQHDVDQKLLKNSLDDVVASSVNAVGVELNTASKELLTYVSGVGPSLAAAIVKHRNENGPFESRQTLKKVPRLGDKAFEQAAGFIRVNQSVNPLDRSAVHPESYPVVEKMAKDLGVDIATLMNDKELQKTIRLEDYVNDKTGLPTLKDIMQELARPGRDPRQKFDAFEFDNTVNSIKDLREGMVLPGIVTNITAFGAFVDVGVHQDGLVHISQMANAFVSNPSDVVKLNQKVMVKVLQVDVERKRITLSMKEANGQ